MPMLDVRFFVAAVVLQKRTGGNLAEILDKLATLIRERFKLRGQIRTISAQGRMSSLVLTAIPIVVGVLLYFVNPGPHAVLSSKRDGPLDGPAGGRFRAGRATWSCDRS
jgi:tight adherence protein B